MPPVSSAYGQKCKALCGGKSAVWHCRRVPSKAYLEFGDLSESACTSAWEMQRLSLVMKALGLLEKHTKEKEGVFFFFFC